MEILTRRSARTLATHPSGRRRRCLPALQLAPPPGSPAPAVRNSQCKANLFTAALAQGMPVAIKHHPHVAEAFDALTDTDCRSQLQPPSPWPAGATHRQRGRQNLPVQPLGDGVFVFGDLVPDGRHSARVTSEGTAVTQAPLSRGQHRTCRLRLPCLNVQELELSKSACRSADGRALGVA